MTATSAQDVRALCDRLEQAHAAATPGPWEIAGMRNLFYDNGASESVVAVRVNHGSGPWERIYVKRDVDATDAALIVAAVNALPSLVSAVRAVADLADELDKFGTDRDRDNADDDESQAASAAAYLRSAIRLRSALAAALSPTEVRP